MTHETSPRADSVSERLRQSRNELTRAERRVAEVLLSDYPAAGLQSVAQFAQAAGVSAPTVLRLVGKLGFSNYQAFRDQLLTEVSTSLFTPVENYPQRHNDQPAPEVVTRSLSRYIDIARTTLGGLLPETLREAVLALSDPTRPVLITGGSFSHVIAEHLANYLMTLRPGVTMVPPERGVRMLQLLSVDEKATLLAFDIRRYQDQTIEFVLEAKRRGAKVILVSDPYLSPLAPEADLVFSAGVVGPPPFDSLAGALLVAEVLVSEVAAELGESARERLADFESLNGAHPEILARLRGQGTGRM